MPADIFASLQTTIQPQTPQTLTTNTQPQPESSEAQPGLFALMIAGLTENETTEGQVFIMPETQAEAPAFTRNNIFAGAVLEVIAGTETQNAETPAQDRTGILDVAPEELSKVPQDDDAVIWPEDEQMSTESPEQPNEQPHSVKQTASPIADKVKDVVQENFAEDDGVVIWPEDEQVSTESPEQPHSVKQTASPIADKVNDVVQENFAEDEGVVIEPEVEQMSTESPEQPSEQPHSVKQTASPLVDKVKDIVQENFADTEISDSEAQDIAEQLINMEGLDELPEELTQEIAQVLTDTVSTIKHEGRAESQPVVKILDAVVEHISSPKAEEKQADSDKPQNSAEIPELAMHTAGLSLAVNTQTQPVQSDSQPQAKTDVLDSPAKHAQPRQVRTTDAQPAESQEVSEPPDTPETPRATQSFRETLDNRHTEQDSSGQDQNQSQNHPQDNFQDSGQPGGGFSGGRNTSRSRTDSRRVESRTQSERADTSTTTRRTESRTTFQAYFEGVLTARRSTAGTSPLPLSLRGTANFTQAAAMRDGIVNVVRFIRADGVQKANIVVDPPALGRISVELTSGTSGVEASIKVASEQIRQLVQEQISQLRMNLSEQGVQVAEFTVDVQQDNSGRHNPNDQHQERGRVNFIGTEDDEPEEFRIDLEEGLLYWVA